MALNLSVAPTPGWPAQWKTIADGDGLGGTNQLALAQQYVNALRQLQLSSLLPMNPITHGTTVGPSGCACHIPDMQHHFMRGESGYARAGVTALDVTYQADAQAGKSAAAASDGSTQAIMVVGASGATANWYVLNVNALALSSGGTVSALGAPYDGKYSAYGSRFVFSGTKSGTGYIERYASSTWANLSASTRSPGPIAMNPTGQYVLIGDSALSNTEVAVSTDGGSTFAWVAHGIAGTPKIHGAAYDDRLGRWVIQRGTGIYTAASVSNPASWTLRATLSGISDPGTRTLVCLPGGFLVALQRAGNNSSYLHGSHDGGVTWTRLATQLGDTSTGYIYPVSLNLSDGYLYVVGNGNRTLVSRRLA